MNSITYSLVRVVLESCQYSGWRLSYQVDRKTELHHYSDAKFGGSEPARLAALDKLKEATADASQIDANASPQNRDEK